MSKSFSKKRHIIGIVGDIFTPEPRGLQRGGKGQFAPGPILYGSILYGPILCGPILYSGGGRKRKFLPFAPKIDWVAC